MAEPNPTTPHQQDVPDYVSLGDLVQAADDLLAQVAERTDDDDQLERVRRARQQLFAARDADEIATDGGTPIVDDREETTNCSHKFDHDYKEYDRDAVYIRYECADCDERREEFRSIDAGLAFLLDDEQDDDPDDLVTDGGVAVDDTAADDGDVWSRPFVETDRHGDATGFEYVRCRDCGAEVLKEHTDDATHKPGCRHR
jgi:hypothetical protein